MMRNDFQSPLPLHHSMALMLVDIKCHLNGVQCLFSLSACSAACISLSLTTHRQIFQCCQCLMYSGSVFFCLDSVQYFIYNRFRAFIYIICWLLVAWDRLFRSVSSHFFCIYLLVGFVRWLLGFVRAFHLYCSYFGYCAFVIIILVIVFAYVL